MTDFTPTPVQPLPGFLQTMLASAARGGIHNAAGALVAFGVFNATQTSKFEDLALSVVLWVGAMAWAYVQHKNTTKAVVAAQALPSPTVAQAVAAQMNASASQGTS